MIYLVSTQVVQRSCTKCQASILTALAEGLRACVDANPITPSQEINALLQNRATYALIAGELVHRDATRIEGGLTGASLYAQHHC